MNHSKYLFDWVRPGIMLYVSTSLPGKTADTIGVKAAIRGVKAKNKSRSDK